MVSFAAQAKKIRVCAIFKGLVLDFRSFYRLHPFESSMGVKLSLYIDPLRFLSKFWDFGAFSKIKEMILGA